MNAASNMICSILLGRRFEYSDKEFRNLLSVLDERVKLIGGGLLRIQVPLLRLLNRDKGELKAIMRKLVSYFSKVVQDHKQKLQETNECRDMIDLYLKEIEQYNEDPEMSQKVNIDHLVAFADNVFFAGSDTSAKMLLWCLLRMIADPDLQRKIREEIKGK